MFGRLARDVVAAWPILPAASLIRPALNGSPDFQALAGQVLGLGATLCLLACLAVSPLARMTRMRQPGRWRQWYGLAMFGLGAEGLVIALAGYRNGDAITVWRISGTILLWTGTLIVTALIPLFLTANKKAQRILGKYWKPWQKRMTYAVWAAVAIHIPFTGAWLATGAFLLASVPLVVSRASAGRQAMSVTQAGKPMPMLIWISVAVFSAGFTLLSWLEVKACLQAVT